jgi:hypothetical protein
MCFDDIGIFNGAHSFFLAIEEVLHDLVSYLTHVDGFYGDRLERLLMETLDKKDIYLGRLYQWHLFRGLGSTG